MRIKAAFRLYVTDAYVPINQSVRRSVLPPENRVLRTCIHGMLEWFLPGQYRHGPMRQLRARLVASGYGAHQALLVYRGIRNWDGVFLDHRGIVTDGGFVSTTLDLETALMFCAGPSSMLLMIHVPWTARVYIPYLVDDHDCIQTSGEAAEMIFPPTTTFPLIRSGTMEPSRGSRAVRYMECVVRQSSTLRP